MGQPITQGAGQQENAATAIDKLGDTIRQQSDSVAQDHSQINSEIIRLVDHQARRTKMSLDSTNRMVHTLVGVQDKTLEYVDRMEGQLALHQLAIGVLVLVSLFLGLAAHMLYQRVRQLERHLIRLNWNLRYPPSPKPAPKRAP